MPRERCAHVDAQPILTLPPAPFPVLQFAKLPAAQLAYLLAHPAELTEVLFYHVVDRRVYAEQLTNFEAIRTLEGEEIVVFIDAAGVHLNGNATVIATNVDCQNGVVHLIDTVSGRHTRARLGQACAAGTHAPRRSPLLSPPDRRC